MPSQRNTIPQHHDINNRYDFFRKVKMNDLLSVSSSNLLGVGGLGTEDLLVSVLLLLSLLSRSLVSLLGQAVSDQSVGWLESLGVGNGLVDQTETSGLATTKLSSETEHRNSVLVGLVQLRQSGSQLVLGHVWSVWVQHVNDELSSSQQWVGDNLSGSDSNSVTLDVSKHSSCPRQAFIMEFSRFWRSWRMYGYMDFFSLEWLVCKNRFSGTR